MGQLAFTLTKSTCCQVDNEAFMRMCLNELPMSANRMVTDEDTCNVAAHYVAECEMAGVPIRMPTTCGEGFSVSCCVCIPPYPHPHLCCCVCIPPYPYPCAICVFPSTISWLSARWPSGCPPHAVMVAVFAFHPACGENRTTTRE